jgi:diadenylate cyclase
VTNFLENLLFIFQRIDWLSAVDILLVTVISFALLYWLRDTQAMVLLRGVILLVVLIVVFTSLVDLPAFSWLVRNGLPALLVAIPVVFAPEIRRALERIGRAGTLWPITSRTGMQELEETIEAVASATTRLSARHRALMVIQKLDRWRPS